MLYSIDSMDNTTHKDSQILFVQQWINNETVDYWSGHTHCLQGLATNQPYTEMFNIIGKRNIILYG